MNFRRFYLRIIAHAGFACYFLLGIGFFRDSLATTDSAGIWQGKLFAGTDSAMVSSPRSIQTADSLPIKPSPSNSQLSAIQSITPSIGSFYDTLAGPLPDRVKADSVPYLVIGDIEVPVNKTVIVEPGAVFLFKNFTGLRVLGKLIALGTKERSIIFTSENDRSVNPSSKLYPNPYDWNGIYIHSDGQGTYLAFCIVRYSVYGIRSDTKFIRLDPIKLRFNGKRNLAIEGKEYQTTDRAFSYVLSAKDATVDGISVKLLKDPLEVKRNIVRFSSYTLAVGGIVGSIYFVTRYLKAQKDLREGNPIEPNRTDLRDSRDGYFYSTTIFGLAGVIGIVGFWWSFTF